jgi:phosphoesterase RecJ-like protein
MEELIRNSNAKIICIDHHQDPENFTNNYFNGIEYCATGHIIYNFIKETKIIEFDYKLALPLYSAIMTDTGSFRFDRTSPEVHQIAAHLVELGVVPIEVHSKIYDQNSAGKLKLLGDALQSLKLYGENEEVAVMILYRNDFLKNKTSENDTEGFINLCMSIKSVNIALKFLEVGEGFKVSLRSKGSIPVHHLAAEFGGGGHQNAAGIIIRDKIMEDLIPIIIQKALEYAKMKESNNV